MARNQDHIRVRTDSTAAQGGTPVWGAAQDANASIAKSTNFRIRFAISNTGGLAANAHYTLNASRNSGAYAAVTAVTTFIQAVDATAGASADQSAITTQLLTGVGTFATSGEYCSGGVTASTISISNGTCIELEYGLVITSSSSVADTFDFEVFENNVVMAGTYLIPRITVSGGAAALIVGRRLNTLLRR